MHIPQSPESIDRDKVHALLDDLGIDRSQLRSITFDYKTATLDYLVHAEGGGVAAVNGHAVSASVTVPLS